MPPHVIAVAIGEFEAWLIADAALIARLTTQQLDQVPRPETLLCGEAKARLDRWLPARDRT